MMLGFVIGYMYLGLAALEVELRETNSVIIKRVVIETTGVCDVTMLCLLGIIMWIAKLFLFYSEL